MKSVKEIFQVGDKVWSLEYGFGNVICVENCVEYPIFVSYKDDVVTYTEDGRAFNTSLNRSLFFQELEIPKEALVRPKWRAEDKQIYYFVDSMGEIIEIIDTKSIKDNSRFMLDNYFKTREEAKQSKFYKVFNKGEEE